MDEFIKHISCPITKKIFYIPVITSDNTVYEAEIAIDLINNNTVSPITNKLLSNEDIVIINPLKSLVNEFIDNNDQYKELVYIPTYDVSTTYLFSKAEIERIFNERINYDNLLKFDQFKIRNIDRYSFKDFLRDADPDVVIHFLDKCDNLEFDWGGSWKIINYICKMSPSRVIRHLIEKEINLENACNTSKWRAIHHVASYHDGGTTRQLVSKGIDLFSKISTGETGLDIIIENQDKDTIMFTLEHIMYLTEDVIAQLLVRLTDNDNIEEMEKEDIKYMIISKLT